tara:strand:+ start:393 stop:518 length:126 start_codon:yes stop_codon:yes gene_type:complete
MKNIIIIIGIVMILTGCARDFDLNPATTIVKQLVNLNKNAK